MLGSGSEWWKCDQFRCLAIMESEKGYNSEVLLDCLNQPVNLQPADAIQGQIHIPVVIAVCFSLCCRLSLGCLSIPSFWTMLCGHFSRFFRTVILHL